MLGSWRSKFDTTGILFATAGITIDGLGITVVLLGIFFVLIQTIGNILKIEPTLKLQIKRFPKSCNYNLKLHPRYPQNLFKKLHIQIEGIIFILNFCFQIFIFTRQCYKNQIEINLNHLYYGR